jgi:acetylornithine/N-succinyldiaminopimelate aminotransferase
MPHLMNTYGRLPVAFTHGRVAGCSTSRASPTSTPWRESPSTPWATIIRAWCKALAAQVGRLIHTSNIYRVGEAEAASDRLAALSRMDEVFFCNSGCEANEAAIKLARMYGHQQGVDQPAIIVMEHAFHGRTLATLSATGNRKVQAGFEPLVAGFVRVPFDDLAAIEQVAAHNPNIVAVLFEPIQGEGGINLAHKDFMRALRQICDQKGWLFMVDEVQCGIGRTGKSGSPTSMPASFPMS